MDIEKAKSVAKQYGEKWSVKVETLEVFERTPLWYFPFKTSAYFFSFKNDFGEGEVIVSTSKYTVTMFSFIPFNLEVEMLPLWVAFPQFNFLTSGWRQSYGESYSIRWHEFFDDLPLSKKEEYAKQYKPPIDPDLGWGSFYEMQNEDYSDIDPVMNVIFKP
ncbi:MAG: hypothetical protein COA79_26575 [Planctomycetota bacterium]|nr:MAG: hypothetical protein COA79_26575 [Planctomycetota bacterium]